MILLQDFISIFSIYLNKIILTILALRSYWNAKFTSKNWFIKMIANENTYLKAFLRKNEWSLTNKVMLYYVSLNTIQIHRFKQPSLTLICMWKHTLFWNATFVWIQQFLIQISVKILSLTPHLCRFKFFYSNSASFLFQFSSRQSHFYLSYSFNFFFCFSKRLSTFKYSTTFAYQINFYCV